MEDERPYSKIFKTVVTPSEVGGTDIKIKTGKEVKSYLSIAEASNAIGRERFWAWFQILAGGAINIGVAYLGIYNLFPWRLHDPLIDLGAYVATFGIAMHGALGIPRSSFRKEALQKYSNLKH